MNKHGRSGRRSVRSYVVSLAIAQRPSSGALRGFIAQRPLERSVRLVFRRPASADFSENLGFLIGFIFLPEPLDEVFYDLCFCFSELCFLARWCGIDLFSQLQKPIAPIAAT